MLGYFLQKVERTTSWCSYIRLTLAVETGYSLDIIKSNVFNDELKNKLNEIPEGSMVEFLGRTITNSDGSFFILEDIKNEYFDSCDKCLAPFPEDGQCLGCYNEPSERIVGTWEVIQKTFRDLSLKFIFKQDENILGYVSFPNSPFHKVCEGLEETQMVNLQGWRNIHRHSKLKYIGTVQCDPADGQSYYLRSTEKEDTKI